MTKLESKIKREQTPCQECPLRYGCYATTVVQPNDVLGAVCGKAYGFSEMGIFWAAPMSDWMEIVGTTTPPKNIEWCIVKDEPPKGQVVAVIR